MVGNVQNLFSMLKKAGYRTGIIGKLHVEPADSFLIDYWPLKSPNYMKGGLDRYARYASRFMNASDTPFFLMVNYPDTHWPFQDVVDGKPAHPVSPEQVVSFPYIGFDNKTIRSYTAGLYNCMMRLDDCIGELMDQLKLSGKRDNTLVFCLSDHGDEMARGKFAIYEPSTKVPFLVSWPGTIAPGIRSDALVSSIDIVPTILDVAGLRTPAGLPGKSLMPLLRKPSERFREYLYTEKNCDQLGMYFPRRAVRDKRYKLIYSLLDGRKNEVALHYTAEENRAPAIAGSPTLKELQHAPDLIRKVYEEWIDPPKVQLYDLWTDPLEFHDLSADKKYQAVKKRLLAALFSWQRQTNDPLRFPAKLHSLTQENDTMKASKHMVWRYPHYLYGQ
jgi:N-sulfoglucosamine sulfohydrolase